MIMLLTCTSISVMAADTQSDTTNQDGKMTIGVSVYNLNDAEVRAFRNYFENYVGMAFDVEFLYSSSISTAEEEISFINELHERNVKGIISFLSSDLEEVLPGNPFRHSHGSHPPPTVPPAPVSPVRHLHQSESLLCPLYTLYP